MEARVDNRATPQVLRKSRLREGRPHPRGATWTGLGVNFAIFSAHATKVELCLFDDQGEREIERIEVPEYTDEVCIVSCPTRAPVPSTVIVSTGLTSPPTATASTQINCCSTLTPRRSSAI